MKSSIKGSVMPVLELVINSNEKILAQPGAMLYMDSNIDMETKMRGGLISSFKRSMMGESMAMVAFNTNSEGLVAFGHSFPGKIIPLNIERGRSIVCQKRAFLCCTENVDLSVHLNDKLTVGFFGGEGFVMQKLSGEGVAFVELDGEYIEKDLADGEILKIETGAVGMFEDTVKMSIERVKGFSNMLLGGEGMFLSTLRGPGKVYIQTMSIQSLGLAVSPYVRATSNR